MATFNRKERKAALVLANRMEEIAAEAPAGYFKTKIYAAVSDIRKAAGFSDAEKQIEIAFYLSQGCSSYQGLVLETRLPAPEVSRIVAAMQAAGFVSKRPYDNLKTGPKAHFLALTDAGKLLITPKK